MKGNQVRTGVVCASVTSILTLLVCSPSASAKGSNEYSESVDSGKPALQATDYGLTKTRERRNHVFSLRVTLPEDEKVKGSQSLASSDWQSFSGTSVSAAPSGIMSVSCRNTFWGGVIAYPQVAGNYRFDADARLRAGGSGYGLAVRASVPDGHTPHGQGIQYDHGMGGLRDVLLPDQSESGTVKPATIDSEWHHIAVAGNHYESRVDGKVVFSGPTPTTGGNGILIRVWRSTADFRNISVTPITALPAP